jgi:hypothetical protein
MKDIGYLIALRDYLKGTDNEDDVALGPTDREICIDAIQHRIAQIGRERFMRVLGFAFMIGVGAAGATAGLVLARLA